MGPDEIRSGRGRGGVAPHHVTKERGATTGAAGSKAGDGGAGIHGAGGGGGGGTGSLK